MVCVAGKTTRLYLRAFRESGVLQADKDSRRYSHEAINDLLS